MKPAGLVSDILGPLLKQEIRRFRASLGHMLTTGSATVIVISLFLYIFGDFIRDKLPGVSPDLARDTRYFFAVFLIIASATVTARAAKGVLYAKRGWIPMLRTFGLRASQLRRLSVSAGIVLLVTENIIVCALLNAYLGGFEISHAVIAMLTIPASVFYGRLRGPKTSLAAKKPHHSCQDTTKNPLFTWRDSRVITGSWQGSSLRVLAALPILFGTVSLAGHAPTQLAHVSSLAGGIILSWTVPFLVAEDLRATWIERQAAVGHDQWIGAWQKIFWSWAKTIFLTTVILYLVSFAVIYSATPRDTLVKTPDLLTLVLSKSLLGGLLAAFPVWMAPAFIMQIDGRRVLTNIVLLTLIGLFAGTALIAVPYLAPMLYLLHREAHRYQKGRFARGSYN
jgi:hypothetical protein